MTAILARFLAALKHNLGSIVQLDPGLAHAIPSIAFIAQMYRRAKPLVSPTISEMKVTDQQRPAQAPADEPRLRSPAGSRPSSP